MKFSRHYQTAWHDTDFDRKVRPSQLLVYMQETSNCHMASCGLTLDELRDQKRLAFILSRISLALYRPLYAFEDIDVQTWTCPGRGFSSNRAFRILRGEDVIAEAYTTWALLDLENGKLCRFDRCDYAFEDEDPPAMPIPARVRFPADADFAEWGKRRIVYSDLDYNGHMNNTRYPDMLCDFLPIESLGRIRGMTLSYLHEAAFGDTVTLLGTKQDGSYYVRTQNEAGVTCLEAQIVCNEG